MAIEKDWTTKAGLRACIVRHGSLGHFCGYVSVAPGHPLHGNGYSEKCEALAARREAVLNAPMPENAGMGLMLGALRGAIEPTPDQVLDVHGGITYASHEAGEDYPSPSADLWWFGFDCNHCFDQPGFGGYTKDAPFVEAECEKLAEQLADLA